MVSSVNQPYFDLLILQRRSSRVVCVDDLGMREGGSGRVDS